MSDAYLSEHFTSEHILRKITLYNEIPLDRTKIHTGVSVIFDMDRSESIEEQQQQPHPHSLACNTFMDCASCLSMRGQRYNCSWCENIGKCSDGYDRSRQQWIRAGCHRTPLDSVCPNHLEETFKKSQWLSSTRRTPTRKSLVQTFRTIVMTLFISVLLLSLVAFAGTSLYAYRYPLSPMGMWLVEHRPSIYLARLRRFTASN